MEKTIVFGQLSRFSALKSDTPIMETARSISIITERQSIDQGALTLDGTVSYTAGVFGQPFGFSTRADPVRVRGLDVVQYQVSLQYLFGQYNNARPDVCTFLQVDILKDPASVLYGQGSPGGLINLISKRPRDEGRPEAQLEVGNHDRVQLGLDSTGRLNDCGSWLYRMVGTYLDTDTQVNRVDMETVALAPEPEHRHDGTAQLHRHQQRHRPTIPAGSRYFGARTERAEDQQPCLSGRSELQ
ncbi:MAG: TonB-dependent receptor plug domain-containing protein [Halioglobus sp.]|nr:TonB-dependent receptor plug domain-containing protein [Halioglobus sp.]